ncbi:MAG: hypothetical protein QMD76_04490 [Anaerosomatales bacterium]|nr:hypothetical protein [Anaerosomatales bacterium]MDI6843696.1 hypothetical protein [Anaerosomatales bacterium]
MSESPGISPDEAVAFVESLRLMSRGRAGFQWLDAKLEELEHVIARLAEENRALRSFVESRGLSGELARWLARGVDDV